MRSQKQCILYVLHGTSLQDEQRPARFRLSWLISYQTYPWLRQKGAGSFEECKIFAEKMLWRKAAIAALVCLAVVGICSGESKMRNCYFTRTNLAAFRVGWFAKARPLCTNGAGGGYRSKGVWSQEHIPKA